MSLKNIIKGFSGIVLILTLASCYKLRIEVHEVPPNTPENAEIYVAGNFNNWDPGDQAYQLTRMGDGVYYVDLPRGIGVIEYKFTRGDWTTVEKDACGEEMRNRVAEYSGEQTLIMDTVRSWSDQDPVNCPQMVIAITKLPENTPPGTIPILAGNVNNWDLVDPETFEFRYVPGRDIYVLNVPRLNDIDYLEYLITRGSLERVEGDPLGGDIKPRVDRFGTRDTVFIEVESWQDLETGKGNQITLIVSDVPGNTPPGSRLYFVGEINDWYPMQGSLSLEKNTAGQYYINLPYRAIDKEYKFTRGGWGRVEVDRYGYDIENRTLSRNGNSDTIYVAIKNWKDLTEEIVDYIPLNVRVPENTPTDDDIYFAANINGWDPGNGRWKLRPTGNNIYFFEVPRLALTLEFKITRGDWATVECAPDGEDIENHTYRFADIEELNIQVERWKDR